MAPRKKNNLQVERDAVRRKVRNAQAKARRLQNNGITSLSNYSPFRPSADISRYNKAQLNAYSRQLDKFTDRNAQFVPDAHGRAMSREKYEKTERLRRARQRNAIDAFERIENVLIRPGGVTLGEAEKMSTPDHPQLHDMSANPVKNMGPKDSTAYDSERALTRSTRTLQDQVYRGYLKQIRKDAGHLMNTDSISDLRGSDGVLLVDRIKNLSDEQFSILWNNRSFSDALSAYYESTKNLLSKQQDATNQKGFSKKALRTSQAAYANDIESLLSSAENPQRRG